jgi:hypothetical protein
MATENIPDYLHTPEPPFCLSRFSRAGRPGRPAKKFIALRSWHNTRLQACVLLPTGSDAVNAELPVLLSKAPISQPSRCPFQRKIFMDDYNAIEVFVNKSLEPMLLAWHRTRLILPQLINVKIPQL